MQKVALITGTSTGLGLALTVGMAQAGFTVFATMRNLSKADGLKQALAKAGVSATILALDVQNTKSIEDCVAEIIKTEGKIDVLVNNAGAGYVKTTEQSTEDEIDWIMDVNFNGVVRCTKAVLPHMRKARSGHIINITSVGGLVGQPFNEIYCAAKFAVEGYTESLASYVQTTFGIKFSLIEPGGITSEFANSVLKQLEASGGMGQDEYLPVLQQYIANAQSRAVAEEGVYQSADDVAKVVIQVASHSSPPLRIRTSKWAEDFTQLKTQADPDGLKQRALIEQSIL